MITIDTGSSTALLDGEVFDAAIALQRGLAFGDGLFETVRARAGSVPLWDAHRQRLARGCARLDLDPPSDGILRGELERLLLSHPDAVLKLMVWRSAEGSGYAPRGVRRCHRLWTVAPLPLAAVNPLRVHWCGLRLSHQPKLAGLKTLNRLEQVLASGERDRIADGSANRFDEGLMVDGDDHAIGATAGNLFAVIDGRMTTPALERCGVAGVFRGWMLQQSAASEPIDVRAILRAEIDSASEVFVTNAVRGIRAIGTLAEREFSVGPAFHTWSARACAAGLMDVEACR